MGNEVLSLYVKTLGCKVNQVESEGLMQSLAHFNVELAHCAEEADIVVVNTCSVTHEADAKTRKSLRKIAREPRVQLVIPTGCSAALHQEQLEALDEKVTVIVDKTAVAPFIAQRFNLQETDEQSLREMRAEHPTLFRTRSFVKVQDGCENFCSYCIVPYARGAMRSQDAFEVRDEVERLAQNDVKEIVLTGINVGRYKDESHNIASLTDLIHLLSETAISRIRISSIEPIHIDDDFIRLFGEGSKVCEHLHIPLQSGSDTVLERMNRNYTCDEFLEIVKKLKQVVPHIALTTDVIVGFPGETEEEFCDTLDLCQKCGFSKIHVFRYSKRQGTPAAEMPQLDPQIAIERAARLRDLGAKLAHAYEEQQSGRLLEVLVESEQDGMLKATSREHLTRTYSKGATDYEGNPLEVGSLTRVMG